MLYTVSKQKNFKWGRQKFMLFQLMVLTLSDKIVKPEGQDRMVVLVFIAIFHVVLEEIYPSFIYLYVKY